MNRSPNSVLEFGELRSSFLKVQLDWTVSMMSLEILTTTLIIEAKAFIRLDREKEGQLSLCD